MEFLRIETIGEAFTFLAILLFLIGSVKFGWWLGGKPWQRKEN
jgi:hypothetical protein